MPSHLTILHRCNAVEPRSLTHCNFTGVKSTDRVGIIGVGGLGHLAIQSAAAMGCEVVASSRTDSKKEESLKLGAEEFCTTNGKSSK